MNELEQQYHKYSNELNKHGESCPIKLKPVDILDQKLKEFIHLQRLRFTEKINARLTRYKDYIHENEIYQAVLSHIHTEEQVNSISFSLFH